MVRVCNTSHLNELGITLEQLVKVLIDMDLLCIDNLTEENEGTFQNWLDVIKESTDTLEFLVDGRKVVGYWHAFILKDYINKKILEGDFSDSLITKMSLKENIHVGDNDIYITAVCLLEEYRDKGFVCEIYKSIYKSFAKLQSEGIKINRVIADVFSEDGRKAFRRLGFRNVNYNKKTGSEIFCIEWKLLSKTLCQITLQN